MFEVASYCTMGSWQEDLSGKKQCSSYWSAEDKTDSITEGHLFIAYVAIATDLYVLL